MVLTKSPDASGEVLSPGGVGMTSFLRIVKIKNNKEEAGIRFFPVATVGKLCINAIAFCGCVSYYCLRGASILLASRPPSLLVTRGFREHALFAPNLSRIFPLLCCVSVFSDGEASGTAEDDGSRGPRPGSWCRARRL